MCAGTTAPVQQKNICKIGDPKTLGRPDSCQYWIGNTAVTVRWDLVPTEQDGVKDLVFKTTVLRAVPCKQ